MDKETVIRRVKELVAEKLGIDVDDVVEDADLVDDLGADSLDLVDLAMAIEDEFGVTIPDENLEKIRTVGDIIENLLSQLEVAETEETEEEEEIEEEEEFEYEDEDEFEYDEDEDYDEEEEF
ncbi:acyl carrier protein [Pseudothermotoga thermarum DSM 5069]|uniref:Acyl carrier protein n=1 Tax=Pseudothermotoga thermarum DSM 5069 TaxID=688269 RepID=F7YX76_9THEM|nr:acyl carrier protein [Pseudothermotoga thermarum DSM 5069]